MTTIDIIDVPESNRYEARIYGDLVGYSAYQLTTQLVVITHTEVLPGSEGQGVGSALARFALEDIRTQGQRKVLLLCPFVKSWIRGTRSTFRWFSDRPPPPQGIDMPRKLYTSPIVHVSFDSDLCEHAAECVRGMPSVFDTSRRPWIDPGVASTEELAHRLRQVVARCPSGALNIEEREESGPGAGDQK